MNIVVYVKAMVDPDKASDDLTLVSEPAKNGTAVILNPYDKNAIEVALQLKEKYTGEVTAVSFGGDIETEKVLREALSLGCDHAFKVNDEGYESLDAFSPMLGSVLGKVPVADVSYFITGREAADDNQSIIGASIAAAVDADFVDNVDEIEFLENHSLKLVSRWDQSELSGIYEKTPLVISVTDTINTPRLPSFKAKMQAKKAKLDEVKVSDLTDLDLTQLNNLREKVDSTGVFEPEVINKENIIYDLEQDEQAVDKLMDNLKEKGIL
ncbi:electron transfer flavoprotein subunit beta/FixA family protein [Agrilactobacillus yilanensis]|uniref:Electron transfer flavoprotein subunit beta/FixA family protein n=1 Tax=Agrilactobacillus yilanensis TaxID=2485997 RepID=A0ABW4J7Y5_9LACO|nr:hypothetical protein [Agrilactobacillus yilanensis]